MASVRGLIRRFPPAYRLASRSRRAWLHAFDPRRAAEEAGERVVYRALARAGFLERARGGRILEVGPKHGEDSILLAQLEPQELVLVDLPSKRELVATWLGRVRTFCPVTYVQANLLYMAHSDVERLGAFDLVWCTGVLYHNVEQLRLLRRLFTSTAPGGAVVVESATARRSRTFANVNAVEIRWPPDLAPTITHLPTRRAIATWLEMVGYEDVEIRDVYSRALRWQRAVLTALRPHEPHPYLSYGGAEGDAFVAGEAT